MSPGYLRGEGFFDGLGLGLGVGLGLGLGVGLRLGASVVGHGTGILVGLLVGEGDGSLGFTVWTETAPSRFIINNSSK